MAKRPSVRFVLAVFLTAFASLWLTWGTLAPRVLFHFDSGNFALSHYYFHPALNQPHLPGYPLFVALSQFVSLFTDVMQTNFLFSGMLAGAGALSFLFLLADAQFGRKAALIATALLFLNPAFLTGGLTNQVRVYLALIACAAAWFGWKVLSGDRPARSLLVGAFVVALLCGFRPEMLLLTMPLLFGPAIVRRLKWPLAAALALYLLTAAPWQAFTVWRTGGEVFAPARLSEAGARIAKYIEVSGRYVAQETQRDSPVFGAGVGGALSLVWKAIVWTFQGLWPALILVAVFGLWRHTDRRQRLLFALWFLPLFAFHATVHIADPDHALSTIPALCLIAGGMLAKWIEDSGGEPGRVRRQTAVAAVVLASSALFLLPVDKITERASYWRIREQTVRNEALVYSLFELQNKGRTAILCHESEYPWRNLAYYFSDQPIVLFPAAPSDTKAASAQGAEPYLFYKSFRKPLELREGRYVLNNVDLLAWPVSINKPENVHREKNDGFVGQFVLLRRPVAQGEEFSVGGYNFIAMND